MTPVFPDQNLRVYNNANFIPNAVALGIKGVMNTAWEDAGVHPETYWIGFVCSAEYAWSSRKPATQEFMQKFFPLFYGRNQQGLSKVYSTLSEKGFIRAESSWTKEFEALDLPPLPDTTFRVDPGWAGQTRQARRTGETDASALRRSGRDHYHAISRATCRTGTTSRYSCSAPGPCFTSQT